ncbi:MAG: hypothetical protein ACRCWF_04440 [Beijerinckiaceae bacterium]
MFRLLKSIFFSAIFVSLAACQSTVSMQTISKIQAAGYQQINQPSLSATGNTGWTYFACPAEKCGKLSIISFSKDYNKLDLSGKKLEDVLREANTNNEFIRNNVEKGLKSTYSQGRLTAANIYRATKHAGINATGTGKTKEGNIFYFSTRVAVRGNEIEYIIGAGESPVIAQRALNLAIED